MITGGRKMNVLFFFTDEMRADVLGCYGNQVSKTPNYDWIAKEGTCFENTYVANPVCVGSRCSLLTGWYPHVNGHRSLLHFIDEHHPNFMKDFKDAGYNVQFYGKNHCLNDEASRQSFTKSLGLKLAWRKDNEVVKTEKLPMFSGRYHMLLEPMENEELEEMTDTKMVNAGVDFLNHYQKGENPFFLFVSLNNPHAPYMIPKKYYDMYNPDDLPELRRKDLENKPAFMRIIREYSHFEKVDDDTFRKCAAVYLGMVKYCDDMLGRLIEALKQNRLLEDTIIVTSSDHGDWAGDYGLVEKWPNAFDDDLTKVPLLIRVPNSLKEHKVKQLVSELDIFPTLLDYAGIKAKHDHFGKSLRNLIDGEKETEDAVVYCEGGYDVREQQCFEGTERDYNFLMRPECIYYPKMLIQQERQECVCRGTMMRKKNWKLIVRTNGENELYNLEVDAKEEKNLYYNPNYKNIVCEMKNQMLDWYLQTSDVVPRLQE